MSECIKWHLYIRPNGYGQANFNNRHMMAHKYLWIQSNGPIPKGMVLDHICHNEAATKGECSGGWECKHRACVNLKHLRLITQQENVMAGLHNIDNRSNCNQGHPFTKENIMIRKSGKRECAECNRVRARNNYHRVKAGA